MKLHPPKAYRKNCVPPLIYYKADPTIDKTLTNKSDSLKVNIKTQPGERDNKTVAIYVALFWREIPEALLKFVTLLHKIIRSQDLYMGPVSLV